MIIAIDFDGTVVEHKYPEIGEERPFATETLKMLIKDHHKLILWSVREGKLLQDAVDWCRERGVEFYAVNKDFPEEKVEYNDHFSRKIKADWRSARLGTNLSNDKRAKNLCRCAKRTEWRGDSIIKRQEKTLVADLINICNN